MPKITVVFPYFENPGMLVEQFNVFNAYPLDVRQNLEMIVVDDCSPLGQRAEEAIEKYKLKHDGWDFQLFRILSKVKWNWLECRNIGAEMAMHDWLVLTDIDHVIPKLSIEQLVRNDYDARSFHIFPRINYHDGSNYKPHPNSYFMTKKLYWRVGGYDESFAGHYGTDGMWRRRCDEVASCVMLGNCPIARVDRSFIADASTTSLARKEGRDPKALDEIREYKEANRIGLQRFRQPWKKII